MARPHVLILTIFRTINRGVRNGGRAWGLGPQWLHDTPQLAILYYCQERSSWVLKIVENVFGRSELRPAPRWGSLQRPKPPSWWSASCCPSPRIHPIFGFRSCPQWKILGARPWLWLKYLFTKHSESSDGNVYPDYEINVRKWTQFNSNEGSQLIA